MTTPFDDDKLHEECGVFGIYGDDDAAARTALGLHALQHRGQEAAGLVSFDGEQFHAHRDQGHVGDIFSSEEVIGRLPGHAAIGHVRYSTTGDTVMRNVQPLFAELNFGGFALAHNGNLTNARGLRRELVQRGSLFQSTTDTEVIIHLVATSDAGSMLDRMVAALLQTEGAYSLVALTDSCVIGVRDPLGVRPLVLGRLGESHIVTSETCALDIIGADFVRDVEAGEMVVLDASGVHSLRPFPSVQRRFCIFEHIYFARPDSLVEGESVYKARKRIGAELSRESHVDADVVIPVPDRAQSLRRPHLHRAGPADPPPGREAEAQCEPRDDRGQAGGPGGRFHRARHHRDQNRRDGARGRRDGSAHAHTEVHMRIAAPPTTHSCFYGIDTPQREELLASALDVEGMARHITVDSLAFISLDGLYRAMGEDGRDPEQPQFCDACFTGDYPIRLTDAEDGGAPAQLSLLAELA
jgi:amidophosphoribosyltransferase